MKESENCHECGKPLGVSNQTGVCAQCLFGDGENATVKSTSDHPSDPAGTGQPPTYLADYKIIDTIGKGGMGCVFLAEQIDLKRTVAIKMIHQGQSASQEELKRFKSEAESVASLTHPNIIDIYDIGEESGNYFFSMEYIDGGDLEDHIKKQPLSGKAAAKIVASLADAMDHAHQKGIVHRDLKPQNILMTSHDRSPRIVDFGIAKNLDRKSLVTQPGTVMGSPSFMSPEQASGKWNKNESHQSTDIYSLGAVLYFLMTGRPPFQAETPAETMRQVLYSEPASPALLNSSLDPDIVTVCLKCLEKKSGHRYSSARELASDLSRYLEGKPIIAKPASRTEKFTKWVKRNPVVSSLALGIIVVALIGFGATWIQLEKTRNALEEVSSLRVRELTARAPQLMPRAFFNHESEVTSARFLPGDDKILSTDIAGKVTLWDTGNKQRLFDLTGHEGILAGSIISSDGSRAYTYSYDSFTRNPHMGPDGKPVLSVTSHKYGDESVIIWDLQNGTKLGEIEIGSQVTSMDLSPDESQLAISDWQGVLRTYSTEDFTIKSKVQAYGSAIERVRFSPDGGSILVSSEGTQYNMTLTPNGGGGSTSSAFEKSIAKCFQTQDLTEIFALKNLAQAPDIRKIFTSMGTESSQCRAVWSPDGQYIATGGLNPNNTAIWNGQTGKLMHKLDGHIHAINDLEFSHDSRFLVTGGADHVALVWSVEDGEILFKLDGHKDVISDVCFSPDDRWIATASADATARVWNASSGIGIGVQSIHHSRINNVSFSHDGLSLLTVSADRGVSITDAAPLTELTKVLNTGISTPLDFEFNKSGSHLVSRGRLGQFLVWDLNNFSHNEPLLPLSDQLGTDRARSFLDEILTANLNASGSHALTLSSEPEITFVNQKFPFTRTKTNAIPYQPLRLWDLENQKIEKVFSNQDSPIASAAWSPNEKYVVAGGSRKINRTTLTKTFIKNGYSGSSKRLDSPTEITVWDAQTGKVLINQPAHDSSINSIWFHNDSQTFISSAMDKSLAWHISDLENPIAIKGIRFINNLEFIQNSDHFVASGASIAGVYNFKTGETFLQLRPEKPSAGIALATHCPITGIIACLKGTNTAYLYDPESGNIIRRIQVARGELKSASFSPDGRFLVLSGDDRLVYVCDPGSGDLIRTLDGHSQSVTSLRFSPDGSWLGSASKDATIRLWPVNAF